METGLGREPLPRGELGREGRKAPHAAGCCASMKARGREIVIGSSTGFPHVLQAQVAPFGKTFQISAVSSENEAFFQAAPLHQAVLRTHPALLIPRIAPTWPSPFPLSPPPPGIDFPY